MKNSAPTGSKFLPFRVDPSQKGIAEQGRKQEVTKVDFLVRNGGKSIICSHSS